MGIRNKPSLAQKKFLSYGLKKPDGKLSMFDRHGQEFSRETVKSCIDHGWCKKRYRQPIGSSWLVCELTKTGRDALNE